ncbi:MAG TPA: DUF2017 family protein [Actinomycetota bacterium]|nr:DUF2017 family protein [Actinomycetota bacterium]
MRTGDSIKLIFEEEEASLLVRLLTEMGTLVADDRQGPITERLFPRTYEDEKDQAKYDELIGDQLRAVKLESIGKVRTALDGSEDGTVLIPPSDVDAWLAGLTDTRVALGTRLQVTEEVMQKDLDPEDPEAPALSVLHWLGWVQESILKELNDAGKGGGPSAAEG